MRQTTLLVLSKIAKNLFSSFFVPTMFLTLASVNNCLQILSTLVLVNIAQPKNMELMTLALMNKPVKFEFFFKSYFYLYFFICFFGG